MILERLRRRGHPPLMMATMLGLVVVVLLTAMRLVLG